MFFYDQYNFIRIFTHKFVRVGSPFVETEFLLMHKVNYNNDDTIIKFNHSHTSAEVICLVPSNLQAAAGKIEFFSEVWHFYLACS